MITFRIKPSNYKLLKATVDQKNIDRIITDLRSCSYRFKYPMFKKILMNINNKTKQGHPLNPNLTSPFANQRQQY